jgi:hypothetical protein
LETIASAAKFDVNRQVRHLCHFISLIMDVNDMRYPNARTEIVNLCANPSVYHECQEQLEGLLAVLRSGGSSASSAVHQERRAIESRTRNFTITESEPWRYFVERGWNVQRLGILVRLCKVWAELSGRTLDREAQRRKNVLFKWLSDNWAEIRPIAEHCQSNY